MTDNKEPTSRHLRCIVADRAAVGECPLWDAEQQALFWVDILQPALHRLDPVSGERRSWPMPSAIGCVALRESHPHSVLVALRSGLHFFDLDSAALEFIAHPEDGLRDNRYNDGKVGPDGRFWFGSMHDVKPRRPLASLYRLDPDLTVSKVLSGLTVSNGLAWSPDGDTMYHSDSTQAVIHAYDYDRRSGALGARRLVAEVADRIGRPDGAAVDVDGFYWSAGVSAGVLNRWSPDGRLDRQIALPCPAPTMPCFGGPELKTLFLTSLSDGQSSQTLADYPQSGSLFALDVDVPGVAVARFRG